MPRTAVRVLQALAVALFLIAAVLLAGRGRGASAAPAAWASHPLWNDGQAEVSAYEAVELRYGQARSYTDYQIVVKEPFSRRLLVKADPGHAPEDILDVIKLNRVIQYRTGIYAYNQMLSYFFDPHDMQPLKWTLAHFEWCGNTFKMFTRRGREALLETHTYWDIDADQRFELEFGRDTLFYDQLPVWLRSQPLEPGTRRMRLYPTQISSKGSRPQAAEAAITVSGEEEIDLPQGGRRRAALVQVEQPDGLHRFWFDPQFPHALLRWERPDGGRGRLLWTRRLKYWDLNQPGDERHLAP
jgi:hypothetical protein